MVNLSAVALDATFGALADPTRRAILRRLAHGEASTSALAAPFAMSLPAVTKHLRVLEEAGLITGFRAGRVHRYRLRADSLRDASDWLIHYRSFWEGQFDALDAYVSEE